jgi:hypothetical protein
MAHGCDSHRLLKLHESRGNQIILEGTEALFSLLLERGQSGLVVHDGSPEAEGRAAINLRLL